MIVKKHRKKLYSRRWKSTETLKMASLQKQEHFVDSWWDQNVLYNILNLPRTFQGILKLYRVLFTFKKKTKTKRTNPPIHQNCPQSPHGCCCPSPQRPQSWDCCLWTPCYCHWSYYCRHRGSPSPRRWRLLESTEISTVWVWSIFVSYKWISSFMGYL